MRDDNPNKPILSRSFYDIPIIAGLINSVSNRMRYMKAPQFSIGAVGPINSRGRSFKGNQRKERAISRRRNMKLSARN